MGGKEGQGKPGTSGSGASYDGRMRLARFVLAHVLYMQTGNDALITDLRSLLASLGVTVIAYVYLGCGGVSSPALARQDER